MLKEFQNSKKGFLGLKRVDFIFLFVILCCVLFIIFVFSSYINKSFITRYVQMFIAFLELKLNPTYSNTFTSQLNEFGNEFPLYYGFTIMTHYVTGLSASKAVMFPYGFILLPLAIVSFIRVFFRKFNWKGLLGASYLLIYYFCSKTLQTGYVSSLAIPVVLLFSASLIRILHLEDVKRNTILALIELAFVIGIWHTAAFYIVFLFGGISFCYLFFSLFFALTKKKDNPNIKSFYNLKIASIGIGLFILAFIVLFLVKKDLLLLYLANLKERFFSGETFWQSIVNLFEPIIRKLTGKPDIPLNAEFYEYNYVNTTGGAIYFFAHLLIHFIAIILLLIGIVRLFVDIHKRRATKTSTILLLISCGVLSAQIVFYFAYSASALGTFYITIMFPIISLKILSIKKSKKMLHFFLLTFLLLSTLMAIASISSNQLGQSPNSIYEDDILAFQWMCNNIEPNSRLFLDFNIHGRLMQFMISNNCSINFQLLYISSASYLQIIGLETQINETYANTYLVLDQLTLAYGLPFHTGEGRGMLQNELDMINTNENLALIYTDSSIAIYSFIVSS